MSVAVLIPMYAGTPAVQLQQALASVFRQSVPGETIRVYLGIDGPLPEDSEQLIERLSHKIYRVVRNEEPIGPTATLNGLIRMLEDERLVFRMDADDECHPKRFLRQAAYMDAHPDIHIVGSAVEEFDEHSGWSGTRTFPCEPDRIQKSICVASPLAHPAVCFRREVLDVMGGYPEIRGQDLAFWFEALRRGYRIGNLPEPLVRVRTSGEFFERRSWLGRAWPEFRIYMRGIWRLHGITWRYVYPVSRLVLRLSGPRISRYLYATSLRNRISGQERRG